MLIYCFKTFNTSNIILGDSSEGHHCYCEHNSILVLALIPVKHPRVASMAADFIIKCKNSLWIISVLSDICKCLVKLIYKVVNFGKYDR